ncbi:uncharacterized protein adgrg2a [Pholidichthys leucotaenia]
MLLRNIRRMHGHFLEGRWKRKHPFLLAVWFTLLAAALPTALGHFLGDTKAVLNGCQDHWTLQDRASMSQLNWMTVCVDIRVVVPGAWAAFFYSSFHAPQPDLGLEGNEEELYGWLLRVKHRFPVQLSPRVWHRVCLRRDVPRNKFSLEVDGNRVAERTVIARAIPPSGSLWLGCSPRDQRRNLVQVELYLFRMWADLGDHGLCEDGTVIGWNTKYWGVTSPNARQHDSNLLCAIPSEVSRALSPSSGSNKLVTCDTRQLCSNTTAYFWIPLIVEAKESNKTEQDVQNLVSQVFSCHADIGGEVPSFQDFCQGDRQLQVVEVSCAVKINISQTRCDAVLQLSHMVSACELQNAGDSALQRAVGRMNMTIIGEVERVGRDLCEGVEPSSGGFVRCTSASSLDDICHPNNSSTLTCSLLKSTSSPAPQPKTDTCRSEYHHTPSPTVTSAPVTVSVCSTGEEKHYCDCRASCNSTSHFYGMKIAISEAVFNITTLRFLLTPYADSLCNSQCKDVISNFMAMHLDCNRTQLSCMVIMEMSRPVNSCILNEVVQQFIAAENGILSEGPLSPMMVCGPLGSSVTTLLASKLTWVASDLLTSDICQPDATLLKCNNNTSAYTATTPNNNYTENYSATTPSKNYDATTLSSNYTTTSNASYSETTQGNSYTAAYTATTAGSNYTTSIENYTNAYNATTPATATIATTATTAFPNHTVVNTATTASNNYRTMSFVSKNVTSVMTAAAQENTTVYYQNTMSPTETSSNTSAVVHVTTTEPTAAPLSNGTSNPTPVITSTTATSSLQTTEGPRVNLTTIAPPAVDTTRSTTVITTRGSDRINAASNGASTATPVAGTSRTFTTIAGTTESSQDQQAKLLLELTQDPSQLNSTQVALVVAKLEELLDPPVSESLGDTAVKVVSNLMGASSEALSASTNRLVRLVDDLGVNLELKSASGILSASSLALVIQTVDGTNFPATSMTIFSTDNIQLHGTTRSRFKRSAPSLGSIVLPPSLTSGLSLEQQQLASRVQFTFFMTDALFQDAALDNNTLVSPVLGCSVANLSLSNLTEKITFTIQNDNPENSSVSCVFWNFTFNDGGGGWSTAGCFVVNATSSETTCSCNHLTSFAILLDLSREGILDRQQARILTFITYIGCGISALFLAVTLLTYLSFPKLLKDIPAKILVQLCLSLLFLNLIFLMDGWLALYPAVGLCISTGLFLHYFLLTSFTWAGLEALHMYLSIVKVFTPYLSKYMLKFTLMGWGIPLIVVVIIIAVDKDNYGLVTYGKYPDGTTDDFCWLRNDIAFYVGVVAYFLLIFILCVIVFIVVMVQLYRIKKQNPQNQSPNRSVMTDMRSIAGLVILLGLTWGFALFAWGPLYLPFIYLFSIFNSLQGFFVFIFHCAVKENVRRQWRTYLCCGKLRLAENSEWSFTATHNRRNFSVATATTSGPQFISRSSSVASDGTNSSGSVFADTRISDGSNNDVILNDIHHQYLLRQGQAAK